MRESRWRPVLRDRLLAGVPSGRRVLDVGARVLQPGGQLHVADWGRPATPPLRAAFLALQLIDGLEGTRDHAAGRLPRFLTDVGFGHVHRYGRVCTAWGTLELLTATATWPRRSPTPGA